MRIAFPPPAPAWSINEERRRHWSFRHRAAAAWREAAFWYARAARVGPQPPSVVDVTLPVVGARRRDPANWSPTVKAIVDGLVLAGLWPDDGPDWVATREPRLEPGGRLVVVTLLPFR